MQPCLAVPVTWIFIIFRLAGFEQNYSSPVIHFAKLTGLSANQTYFYTVGDGSTANTSPVLNFTTPPAPGAYPVRLYAMADLGQVRISYSKAQLCTNFTLRYSCYGEAFKAQPTCQYSEHK